MKNIKFITTTIISLLLILSISGCDKKDEPTLPVHQPGRIVTCTIDGQPWSHGVEWCPACHSLVTDYYVGSKKLDISARNFLDKPFHNSLNIYIYADSVGYTSPVFYTYFYTDYDQPEDCTSGDYFPDTTYTNEFYIEEIDHENHKIRGTFEMRVINYKCQDTVMITDGYFDVNPYWND